MSDADGVNRADGVQANVAAIRRRNGVVAGALSRSRYGFYGHALKLTLDAIPEPNSVVAFPSVAVRQPWMPSAGH